MKGVSEMKEIYIGLSNGEKNYIYLEDSEIKRFLKTIEDGKKMITIHKDEKDVILITSHIVELQIAQDDSKREYTEDDFQSINN